MVHTYHLVIDRPLGRTVHVFVARPPGFRSISVVLHRLPEATLSPVVGRDRDNPRVYAEFPSAFEAARSGFVLITSVRVCDTWAEYLEPCAVTIADPTRSDDPDTTAITTRIDTAAVLRR